MGLFGHGTQQPGGNPEALRAIQEAANRGDTTALRAIAAGSRARGIRGINDSYNYGENTPSGAAYRAFAQSLLAGDTGSAQTILQRAGATFRPSSRGLLASVGVPVLGAMTGGALGAAASGTLGRAIEGQPISVRGALTDVAKGLGGRAVLGAIGGAGALAAPVLGSVGGALGGLGTAGGGLLAGAGRAIGAAGRAIGGVPGALGLAQQAMGGSSSGGGGILGTGLTGSDVLAGVGAYQGAQREGQANELRERALASLAPSARPDLSAAFADPGNPYQRPPANTALQAARSSLRGY